MVLTLLGERRRSSAPPPTPSTLSPGLGMTQVALLRPREGEDKSHQAPVSRARPSLPWRGIPGVSCPRFFWLLPCPRKAAGLGPAPLLGSLQLTQRQRLTGCYRESQTGEAGCRSRSREAQGQPPQPRQQEEALGLWGPTLGRRQALATKAAWPPLPRG